MYFVFLENLEIIAIISAIIYLIFAALENPWCWFFGIITSLLYVYIFFVTKLYLESILQIFYIFAAYYGWQQWKKNKISTAIIHSISFSSQLQLILISEVFSLFTGFIFNNYTQAAMPWIDAHITVYSIVVTYMTTKKIIENWIWWFFIDTATAYVAFVKDLKWTALLNVCYVIMVVFGYLKWKKEMAK